MSGYTLVAHFSKEDEARLRGILAACGAGAANKVPYGRGCDRKAADAALPHHVTTAHWSSREHAAFLPRLEGWHFPGPCRILLGAPTDVPGKEGSRVMLCPVESGEAFFRMLTALCARLHCKPPRDPHVTLAVSRDHRKLRLWEAALRKKGAWPLTVTVTGLTLYRIWEPVVREQDFT